MRHLARMNPRSTGIRTARRKAQPSVNVAMSEETNTDSHQTEPSKKMLTEGIRIEHREGGETRTIAVQIDRIETDLEVERLA